MATNDCIIASQKVWESGKVWATTLPIKVFDIDDTVSLQ